MGLRPTRSTRRAPIAANIDYDNTGSGLTAEEVQGAIDEIVGSFVPSSRTLTAGAGMVGGGDLSADRTFDVVATDGSIVVLADSIGVGVLQSDAQHGDLGGGSLHALATTLVAGFMSPADKTKLDGISKFYFQPTDPTNQDRDTYRVINVGTNQEFNFNFLVPSDFNALVNIVALAAADDAGAAGSGKDIDLESNYGGLGESIFTHNEIDNTSTYTIPNPPELFALDLSSVFSSLVAGDFCSVLIDHNGIGGEVSYFGIWLEYT